MVYAYKIAIFGVRCKFTFGLQVENALQAFPDSDLYQSDWTDNVM